MEKLELFSSAKNGKVGKAVSKQIGAYLLAMEGKRIKIVIDKVKKSRSAQQNSYLHVLFTILTDGLNELGNNFSMSQIKELVKLKFLTVEVVNEDSGEVIGERVKGTSELTTTEMVEFVDNIIAYAKDEFNITCPLPNEQLKIED